MDTADRDQSGNKSGYKIIQRTTKCVRKRSTRETWLRVQVAAISWDSECGSYVLFTGQTTTTPSICFVVTSLNPATIENYTNKVLTDRNFPDTPATVQLTRKLNFLAIPDTTAAITLNYCPFINTDTLIGYGSAKCQCRFSGSC